jgi:hypothetical protein
MILNDCEKLSFMAEEEYDLTTMTFAVLHVEGHDILPPFWRIKFPAFFEGRMSFRNLVPPTRM